MTTRYIACTAVFCILLDFSCGFSTEAGRKACNQSEMRPFHRSNNAAGIEPPFTITLNSSTYRKGDGIQGEITPYALFKVLVYVGV